MLSTEAQVLSELLIAKGLTISVADSCTGGSLSGAITSIPGASSYFDCGYVTYSNQSKVDMLGVDIQTIKTYGAVSEEVALEMVIGVATMSHSDIAVSITGGAGPKGGTKKKPVGLVYIGIKRGNKIIIRKNLFKNKNRNSIQKSTVDQAHKMILNII